MAKHKPEANEYIGQFDDGTYQTGAIRPPKSGSALVAFLMAMVIFLAGLCSGLGFLNVKLLSALSQLNRETTPLSLSALPSQPQSAGNTLETLELPPPQLPENRSLTLQIADSPRYSQGAQVLSAQEILDAGGKSVVQVQCLTHFGDVQSGVGLVLSADGYILTNHHTVDSAKRIFVTLSDGTVLRAALVGSDSFPDLAVLYVQAQGLTPAVFSSNTALQADDPGYVISRQSESQVINSATVFQLSRAFWAKCDSLHLIQIRADSADGPVFDSFGRVIGFQVSRIDRYFPTAGTAGVGLVVPTDTIRQIVSSLLQQGCVAGRPSLGIEVEAISKVYQEYWQLPDGLLLTSVEADSDAAMSGLEEGDILLALDGESITCRSDLYAVLYDHNIGDAVEAVISRDEQEFTVILTIEDNCAE